MKLEQEFTIPVEVERAWEVLLDVEQIAPCFPGATLTSVEGDSVTGSVKVKLGPVLLTYNGVAKFEERDAANRRVVIAAHGTAAKGNGNANAQVTASLEATGPSSTTCFLVTDLNVTGRPAQFGRGMMLEIGNKILGQFSANLAASLAESKPQPLATGSAQASTPDAVNGAAAPARAPEQADAIDLLGAARGSVIKRVAPVAAVVLAVALVVWWAIR